jgi:Cu/Ag efflux pump CusA
LAVGRRLVTAVSKGQDHEDHLALRALLNGVQRNRQAHPRGMPLAVPPHLMTTLWALLAGVPLMLGIGIGSEIRQPLGYAMVG